MTAADIDVETAIDEAPVSGLQVRVVVLCALAAVLDGYDIQALSLALPGLAESAGVPPRAFVPAITGSLAGMAAGAILLAPLADRFGRKPLMVALMALIGLSSLGAATTHGVYDLAFWRVLTGLGIGACVPVASAMIAEYAPRRRRAAMITCMACSIGVGAMSAAFIAPMLNAPFGWKGIFIAGGLLPLLSAVLLWAGLPESLAYMVRRRPGDPRIATVLRRIGSSVDPDRLRVRAETAVRQSVTSLLSPTYRARTLLVWAIVAMNLFVNYVIVSWLPTLMRSAGWSLELAQRSGAIASIGGIAGGLALSWAADRGRPVLALSVSYFAAAAALVLFPFFPPTLVSWGVLLAVTGAGCFGAQFTLTSIAASYYPASIRATGLGWISAAGRVGSIAGPTLAAVLLGNMHPSVVLAALTLPMLICGLAVTILPWTLKDGGDDPAPLSGIQSQPL
jgi:AAHS family 4-hydroxybenzoate transporter-like MFS transporter